MHIVFVAPFGLGQKTTVWARILPLARELVAHGHRVTILIPPWDTPEDAGTVRVESGVEIRQVALGGGLPMVLARLLWALWKAHPDVVHIVKPLAYAGMVQWLLWYARGLLRPFPWLRRLQLVLDLDDWEQAWTPINGYSWPVRRFVAWQEEWGIRHADAITAASRWLTERAGAYAPHTPVLYLPNGITPPDAEATSPARSLRSAAHAVPTVLYFSRFIEVEPEWLVAFWEELRRLQPAARLCIAGRALQPGREAQFEAAFRKKGIAVANAAPGCAAQPGVELRGFVQPHALAELYRETDCAIFPAQDIPLHQAKCSVRLVTTLLHGVPVVASAVGQQAEYGANGAARLVPAAATPAQFAAAVSGVLHAPEQQRSLARRAQAQLFSRYSWSRLGAELDQLYNRR